MMLSKAWRTAAQRRGLFTKMDKAAGAAPEAAEAQTNLNVACKVVGVNEVPRLSQWGRSWTKESYDLASGSEVLLGAEHERERAKLGGVRLAYGDFVQAELERKGKFRQVLHKVEAGLDVSQDEQALINATADTYTPLKKAPCATFPATVLSAEVSQGDESHVHWYTVATEDGQEHELYWTSAKLEKPLFKAGYHVQVTIEQIQGDSVLLLRAYELRPMTLEGRVFKRVSLPSSDKKFVKLYDIQGQQHSFWEGDQVLREGAHVEVSLVASSSGKTYEASKVVPMKEDMVAAYKASLDARFEKKRAANPIKPTKAQQENRKREWKPAGSDDVVKITL
eukprot:TRINITY_DN5093_c0_g1_i1.p1 TRINITY_DN5093_c0_g1~~TRINITY_DN5093_c0_g1_i1.p1  ORF type:complete len:337 (+),score=143.29 TRINITY_DN5093_c0_g1_i1:48-1058(+)